MARGADASASFRGSGSLALGKRKGDMAWPDRKIKSQSRISGRYLFYLFFLGGLLYILYLVSVSSSIFRWVFDVFQPRFEALNRWDGRPCVLRKSSWPEKRHPRCRCWGGCHGIMDSMDGDIELSGGSLISLDNPRKLWKTKALAQKWWWDVCMFCQFLLYVLDIWRKTNNFMIFMGTLAARSQHTRQWLPKWG